jgi:hypothetical protein
VTERPFEVAASGGDAPGPPGGLRTPFETFGYTQRGTPPSTSGPPYTVETHMGDAVAVLDHFEIAMPDGSSSAS